jgi:hypothetical protein
VGVVPRIRTSRKRGKAGAALKRGLRTTVMVTLLVLWCGDPGWTTRAGPLPATGSLLVALPLASASAPVAAGGCGLPHPPPIAGFSSGTRLAGEGVVEIDAAAIVGPDVRYCSEVGFPDGRSLCTVRLDGDPDRDSCQDQAVGRSRDTGRLGPTWTVDGQLCRGLGVNGCANHPDDQYRLRVSRPGTYLMCAANGACGAQRVGR